MKPPTSKTSAIGPGNDRFIIEEVSPEETIQYEKLRVLGKGTFSKVFECEQTNTKAIYAIKVVSKAFLIKHNLRDQFTKEVKIHFQMDHPNIIKLHKMFENRSFIYMVMESSNNGTIADLIERRKKLSEVEARYYFKSMIEGIKYIHDQKIVHRDLKPANLIISNKMELKIADFGLASNISGPKKRKTFCGTPFFIAPEIFNKKDGHSFEVDWWSAGIILYNMVYGKCPFYAEKAEEVYQKIKEEEIFLDSSVTSDLNDLITKLLSKNVETRANYQVCLASNFLNKTKGPDFLPTHFLETAPSESFIVKYEENPSKEESEANNLVDVNVYSKDDEKEYFYMQDEDSGKEGPLCAYEYVKKWVNFSEFGIGYILNNGIIGIFFTDKTKIVLSNFGISFNYIYTTKEKTHFETYNIVSYPKELEKKVKILDNFITYLKNNALMQKITENTPDNFVYVRNYKIQKYVVIFQLSNNICQSIFEDGSEVHINKNDETRKIIYVDKQRNRFYSDGKNLNDETLVKRIKYIKEVLK